MSELLHAGSPAVEYPVSDGKPMAETDLHRDLMFYGMEALDDYFAADPQVYVSSNNFVYYEEGNPRKCVSPDLYVVFGVPKHRRDCYQSWKEGGRLPEVVIEFTSRSTKAEDTGDKWRRYEQELRVPEYFVFDPRGDYQRPRLRAWRLAEGRYVPLEVVEGRVRSERLGLELVQQGALLRFFDPRSGEWLRSYEEWRAAAEREAEERRQELARRQAAESQAQSEAERRQAAEAELAALRAELERLRGKPV